MGRFLGRYLPARNRRGQPRTGRWLPSRASMFLVGLCATLAALLGADAALGAPSSFSPQGGRWPRSEGSTNNYFAGMSEKSVPTQHAIRVWQELLNEHGADLPITGHFGPLTAKAVAKFQGANGLSTTGRINYVTARALLARTIRREAKSAGIPASILCGHLAHESVLDPGAVGATGEDLGIGQVVLRFVPELTTTTVWDEDAAIRYMARRDAAAFRAYGTWQVAIVAYNSPLRAQQWDQAGHATSQLASDYSKKALAGCGALPETKAFGVDAPQKKTATPEPDSGKPDSSKLSGSTPGSGTAESAGKGKTPGATTPAPRPSGKSGATPSQPASSGPGGGTRALPVTALDPYAQTDSDDLAAEETPVQRLLLTPVAAVTAITPDSVAPWQGGTALGSVGVFVAMGLARRRRQKAARPKVAMRAPARDIVRRTPRRQTSGTRGPSGKHRAVSRR